MVNTSDFVNRLQKILDHYGLTASAFADELNIQRSSISHLFSGRNNPSLDFILKLTERFPEVDIYWITQGKGSFPSFKEQSNQKIPEKAIQTDLFTSNKSENVIIQQEDCNSSSKKQIQNEITDIITSKKNKNSKIKKIIFFYDDNSFEIFENL